MGGVLTGGPGLGCALVDGGALEVGGEGVEHEGQEERGGEEGAKGEAFQRSQAASMHS